MDATAVEYVDSAEGEGFEPSTSLHP